MLAELNAKHAIFESCFYLLGVNQIREFQRALEFAEAAFMAVHRRVFNRCRFAFALQRKLVAAGNEDLDVVGLPAYAQS